MPAVTNYPVSVRVRVLPEWPARIDAAARAAELTRAEWLRRTLRRALENAERAQRRRETTEADR